MLVSGQDGNGTLINGDSRVDVDPAPECADASLVGRRDDGGYLLHGYDGQLLHLDATGQLDDTEPAVDEWWLVGDPPLTISISIPVSPCSVTPAGEVILAVLTREGLHVVGLAKSVHL